MTEMAMRPYYDHAAVETGIEIGMNEDIPDTMEEVEKCLRINPTKTFPICV